MQTAQKNNIKKVYIRPQVKFIGLQNMYIDEKHPLNAQSPYSTSKFQQII